MMVALTIAICLVTVPAVLSLATLLIVWQFPDEACMTAQEIADRYRFSQRGQTPARLEKAKALAARMGVPWSQVEELLSKESV